MTGSPAIPSAEHTLLLMLAVWKWLPQHHAALRQGQWLGHAKVLQMFELQGKTVGVVGFGHMGRELAHVWIVPAVTSLASPVANRRPISLRERCASESKGIGESG